MKATRYMSHGRVCAAAVLGWLLLSGCGHHAQAGKHDQAVPVTLSVVERRSMPMTLAAVGSLESASSAAVRARVDGQLMRVAFKDGEEVKAGQLLFQLDERPFAAQLAQARATLAKDTASLERARAQRLRYEDLLAKHYVSSDDYAQIKANEDSAAATVQADRALVENAQLNLNYCSIHAPISGRMGAAALRVGNLVKASDGVALVTIARMDPLYAEFAIAQQYLDALRSAMQQGQATITLTTSATDAAGHAHPSKVDFIDNMVDRSNGTIRVRATVDNKDRTLWPRQFIHVRLQLNQSEPVLTVPASALGVNPEGHYVFVVTPDNRAQQTGVTLLRQEGDVAIVSKGLEAGMRVVSDGQARLRDKSLVSALPQANAP